MDFDFEVFELASNFVTFGNKWAKKIINGTKK